MTVLLEAICTMNPKPATTRQGIASQSTCVKAKAISPTLPEYVRKGEGDQPDTEEDGRTWNDATETDDGSTPCQPERPQKRAATRRGHENAQRMRPAVEDRGREDWHQHRIRNADEADER